MFCVNINRIIEFNIIVIKGNEFKEIKLNVLKKKLFAIKCGQRIIGCLHQSQNNCACICIYVLVPHLLF